MNSNNRQNRKNPAQMNSAGSSHKTVLWAL